MTAQDAYDLAQRFIGVKEVPGSKSNSFILAMLQLDDDWPTDDAVPWCSAFMNFICWLARLPRSKSLVARSWLGVGSPVGLFGAQVGDVVILNRGGIQDPEVLVGPGHVGFYTGYDQLNQVIHVLGGNQRNMVSVQPFAAGRLLGIRRLV